MRPRILLKQAASTPSRLCYARRVSAAAAASNPSRPPRPRHAFIVRVTHWLTFLAFLALLITGGEIVISHPRFYWGEVGNAMTRPLFTIPIPASRDTVPTGYGYVMPDQNGWSRYLHFEAAWVAVLTGLVYVIYSFWTRHFRKDLLPEPGERSPRTFWRAFRQVIARYLHRAPPGDEDAHAYNIVQRTAYLAVIFVLFPLVIWTGLAMSPAFTAAVPASVVLLGGRQSARTLHFIVSGLLLLFLIVHVTMIALGGFWPRVRAMITGRAVAPSEREEVAVAAAMKESA